MVFYQADDGTSDCSWVMAIPRADRNAAAGLWIRCATHCSRNLTDGFINEEVALGMQTGNEIAALVAADAWVRDDVLGGWQMNWAGNRTKAEVVAYRAAEAERKRTSRRTSARTSSRTSGGESGAPSEQTSGVESWLGKDVSSSKSPYQESARTSERTSGRTAYSPLPYLQPFVPQKSNPARPEVAAAAAKQIRDDLAARRAERDAG